MKPLEVSLYVALFALLAVYAAMRVIRLRWAHGVSLGDGGVKGLEKANRAFGNMMEYVPFGLFLLFCVEMSGAPAWLVHSLGSVFFLGRVSHLHGVGFRARSFRTRQFGMVITFLVYLVSSFYILVVASPLRNLFW